MPPQEYCYAPRFLSIWWTVATGNPTTFDQEPSIQSMKRAARPWIAIRARLAIRLAAPDVRVDVVRAQRQEVDARPHDLLALRDRRRVPQRPSTLREPCPTATAAFVPRQGGRAVCRRSRRRRPPSYPRRARCRAFFRASATTADALSRATRIAYGPGDSPECGVSSTSPAARRNVNPALASNSARRGDADARIRSHRASLKCGAGVVRSWAAARRQRSQ